MKHFVSTSTLCPTAPSRPPLVVDSYASLQCVQYVLDMLEVHKEMMDLKSVAEKAGSINGNYVDFERIGEMIGRMGPCVNERVFTIEEIRERMDEGSQFLTMLDMGGEKHCAAVLDVDMEEHEVMVYDPTRGIIPETIPLDRFIESRKRAGDRMIEILKDQITYTYDC